MSVLVYIEVQNGKLRKASHELAYYAVKSASILGVDCCGIVVGDCADIQDLGQYGLTQVEQLTANPNSDNMSIAAAVVEVAQAKSASFIVFGHNSIGKSLLPMTAVKLSAGTVSGVNSLPNTDNGFTVDKNVFSGKAIASYQIHTPVKAITLMGNSLKPEPGPAGAVTLNASDVSIGDGKITVIETKREEGTVPLPEAELVVSAGRGMKGPENWGIIDELANTLGATTACSRPVADIGWRPHHEHVGQTGVAIRPNLYIAIGISGAIQHLAGVNSSKTIVVINKDPEAPFFKAADYGICADLFDVVPKLTAAIRKFKEN